MLIKEKVKTNLLFWLVIQLSMLGLLLVLNTAVYGQTKTDTLFYTVKPGDFLVKIGVELGSPNFWKPIYKANGDQIEDENLIFPGQKLVIPYSVRSSEKFVYKGDVDEEAVKKTKQDSLKVLAEFRKAFNALVKEQKKEEPEPKSPDVGIGLGGLVINETKTKMGNNFYNIFYDYWEAPEKAENFILTISEQPTPSLGTLVTIKIDHKIVYKTRLQPKYVIIEKLAKQAVVISYRNLSRQISTSSQLISY